MQNIKYTYVYCLNLGFRSANIYLCIVPLLDQVEIGGVTAFVVGIRCCNNNLHCVISSKILLISMF